MIYGGINMKEAIKKLTQVQKNYLIRRIDMLTAQKLDVIWGRIVDSAGYVNYNRRYPPVNIHDLATDAEAMDAIAKGKVKLNSKALNSKAYVIDRLKKRRDAGGSSNSNRRYLDIIDFIDKASLRAFNRARNGANKKAAEERNERVKAVSSESEAAILKDKVMLEGSLAVGLLKDFEKKEF
jgi:hypothetical protein